MGDGNSSGTIPMAVNGGGAMDGRTAATAQCQSTWMVAEAKWVMATAMRVAGGWVTATTTKRAMATAMRVAGNKKGNGDGGKSNGDGVKGGRWWQWQ
jgi:hypothetical protein